MTACSAMDVLNTITIGAGQSFHKVYLNVSDEQLPARFVLERDASLDIIVLSMPGEDCDMAVDIELAGEGASANISGAYICGDSENVRIAVDMRHGVPGCNSSQLFKGLAGGKSKIDFYGKITVAKDAQKTAAFQENHNILLSDYARVNTRPQLEIYADDVKCSHGATVGRLNEEELFYMRSRGISLEDAKVLQMVSFLSPVMEGIQDEHLREELAFRLDEAVRDIVRGNE